MNPDTALWAASQPRTNLPWLKAIPRSSRSNQVQRFGILMMRLLTSGATTQKRLTRGELGAQPGGDRDGNRNGSQFPAAPIPQTRRPGERATKPCATNSSHPNSGVEIFVPGLGLLSEQNPLADRPISFERSPRIFHFQISQGRRELLPTVQVMSGAAHCYITNLRKWFATPNGKASIFPAANGLHFDLATKTK